MPKASAAPLMYRRGELAELLAISEATLDRYIARGEIAVLKMPGAANATVLIPAESVAEFQRRHTA